MAAKICGKTFLVFAIAYAAALLLFAVGVFGLFGQERDPLSAVYLVLLGLPWNQLVDGAVDSTRPWLMSLAPLVNLLLLGVLCRFLSRGQRRGP